MNKGLKIGRIMGITIYVDWSWTFIFLLITWELGAGVFPQMHPDWSPGLSWTVALVASLLFFASILLHELAHSAVAKAKGLPVRSITLFLFGGVSNIEREPDTAGTEFLMAIVGPLTSLALGAIFLLIGRADAAVWSHNPERAFAGLDPVATLLMWLGPINILLGVFNLVPGFPLDGGRVLRSILWGVTGNLHKATRWASWCGQVIAWLFIVTGISMIFGANVPVFGTGLIGGVWLAFIGWFLNSAAVQSYRQMAINDLLEGVPVSRLMRKDLSPISPDMPVTELVHDWIIKTDDPAFPVLSGDHLDGVVTVEEVRKLPQSSWGVTHVSQIMTPADKVATVTPEEGVAGALTKLTDRNMPQLPVMDHGKIVGMLRQRDILRWLQLNSRPLAS
ncbi:MAG TPA: site-2 protease family protein [Blastocatellia bacterium]